MNQLKGRRIMLVFGQESKVKAKNLPKYKEFNLQSI